METIDIMFLEGTIEEIKKLRNSLQKNEHRIIMGENPYIISNLIRDAESIEIATEQCNLNPFNIAQRLIELDDIDGLTYEYGVDVPEDHDSVEYEKWKEYEYNRIEKELDRIIESINDYLAEL